MTVMDAFKHSVSKKSQKTLLAKLSLGQFSACASRTDKQCASFEDYHL